MQNLYTQAVNKVRTPVEIVAALKQQLANNSNEQKLLVGVAVEPNYKLVETLLEGVQRSQIRYRYKIKRRFEPAAGNASA